MQGDGRNTELKKNERKLLNSSNQRCKTRPTWNNKKRIENKIVFVILVVNWLLVESKNLTKRKFDRLLDVFHSFLSFFLEVTVVKDC